nr:MAG TPA: Protein of unknown function (DUF1492) [Caudoviricetes sp.]
MQPVTPRPRATDAEPRRYVDAREFFAAVRDASREAGRIQSTARRMQDSEGLRGSGGFEPRVRSSNADPTGMARVDARIDFEAANERRLEEDYALIDAACAVIYGRDGRGDGLERLMGSAVSDCMWWRFCAAESWAVVADACGYSKSQARRLCAQGLDACDFFGWPNVVDGTGSAEG